MAEESIKNRIEELVNHTSDLGETAFKLARINAYRKTADLSAQFLFRTIISVVAACIILFSSIAAALWLGDLTHSRVTGFLLVGAFYFLLLLLVLVLKNKLLMPFLRNRVVKKLYD